ncbi:hypothetical protein [Deinococcus sonorensis]|uniref:DUF3618 domain-containing protein n=2 Tax=Deinococcus sonorensis TaxID=309891 RepID=A0AAU7UAK5_9DEIO
MMETVKQSAQDLAETMGDHMQERKIDQQFNARLKGIERNLSQIDDRIDALGKRFPRKQGGGFPWGLVLMAGLGYALYNPSTRTRLMGMIGNVSPAARDVAESAVSRAGNAVQEVREGRSPVEAAKSAAQDIGQQAKSVSNDVKRDVEATASRTADKAKDQAQDVKDRLSH